MALAYRACPTFAPTSTYVPPGRGAQHLTNMLFPDTTLCHKTTDEGRLGLKEAVVHLKSA